MQQTFIHTKETDETEIVCVVHASPRAKVEWFKNGQKMGDDDNKWVRKTYSGKLNVLGIYPFIKYS